MAQGRARKGGEIGTNGEFYEGGKFLPSTEMPKRTGSERKASTGKQEIANYTWEVPPTPEHKSIFTRIAGKVAGWKVWNQELHFAGTDNSLAYAGLTREQADDLIYRWNHGERWYIPQ